MERIKNRLHLTMMTIRVRVVAPAVEITLNSQTIIKWGQEC